MKLIYCCSFKILHCQNSFTVFIFWLLNIIVFSSPDAAASHVPLVLPSLDYIESTYHMNPFVMTIPSMQQQQEQRCFNLQPFPELKFHSHGKSSEPEENQNSVQNTHRASVIVKAENLEHPFKRQKTKLDTKQTSVDSKEENGPSAECKMGKAERDSVSSPR